GDCRGVERSRRTRWSVPRCMYESHSSAIGESHYEQLGLLWRPGGVTVRPMDMLKLTTALTLALALAACAPSKEGTDGIATSPGSAPDVDANTVGIAPADEFLARLAEHCGQAFAGRIVANEPQTNEPDAFEGRA